MTGTERFTPSVPRTGDIVLPPIHRAPGLSIELSGLVPNRDHNGDVLRALERMPHCLADERPVIGIFAADPFLRIGQMATRLAEKGYWTLANLPSVTQYGAAFRPVLNDLKVGPAREMQVLKEFADLGFSVSVAITHVDDIAPAFALAPVYLFVVPSFDQWHDGKLDPAGPLALCSVVAERRRHAARETPIILFGGRAVISMSQAQDAGADGLLLD